MRRKIPCKVIKSVPLCDEDVISLHEDSFKIRHLLSCFDIFHAEPKEVIYTKKMVIKREPVNDYPSGQVDFYA